MNAPIHQIVIIRQFALINDFFFLFEHVRFDLPSGKWSNFANHFWEHIFYMYSYATSVFLFEQDNIAENATPDFPYLMGHQIQLLRRIKGQQGPQTSLCFTSCRNVCIDNSA